MPSKPELFSDQGYTGMFLFWASCLKVVSNLLENGDLFRTSADLEYGIGSSHDPTEHFASFLLEKSSLDEKVDGTKASGHSIHVWRGMVNGQQQGLNGWSEWTVEGNGWPLNGGGQALEREVLASTNSIWITRCCRCSLAVHCIRQPRVKYL